LRIWGISALSHDAALSVVDGDVILFAAHAERYSRRKNDPLLNEDLLAEALAYGPPELIAWYERPCIKKLRHVRAGQWHAALTTRDFPKRYLKSLRLPFRLPEVRYSSHHGSHAAAGFATSGYDEAAVIVADAIGEFLTFTIGYYNEPDGFQSLHQCRYPHSLGLLYSAFTRRCGFKPNEDEYVVMGMAAFGKPLYTEAIYDDFLELKHPTFKLRFNPHRGIGNWQPEAASEDLAASIQKITENVLLEAARWARARTKSRHLIFMGGVALNCVINAKIAGLGLFDKIWIFPNPGDAGSCVGAAAALSGHRLSWLGPYLGTCINRSYPVTALLNELLTGGIAGVANGRAEFGPRALGNRSLLADPRPADMKERVNRVKGRERFRPFGAVIRQERVHEFFDLPVVQSPYMQFTARCRYPSRYPSIVHLDGTSRVQTVTATQHPGLYELLTLWEEKTGCPMMLNTSLNSRGEPLVNSIQDAEQFSCRHSVPVY
jgi:carbamoyltransferase